jgi:6-phospho-beta-glucosidase
MHIIEGLEQAMGKKIDPDHTDLKTLGLNHLSWHRGFSIDGEDVWPQVIQGFISDLKKEEHPEWDPRTIETLRMMPNYYLQYFYYTDKKLKSQEAWPPSRAEEVMEVEKDLLREYADPNLKEPPADLMKRGGAYYSTVATQLLNAHYNDLGETHVVNIKNGDAVKEWPAEWVLEIPSTVKRSGITPIPTEPLPASCFGLIAAVKAYEMLTVEAAVHGDREAAYQALLVHPLGPKADRVQAVLDDMLETHQEHLPQFWN